MKAAIYGAGAIGGWIGVKLAQAGHEVGVVARGPTLAALREEGLRLIEGMGSSISLTLWAFLGLESRQPEVMQR